jgi:SAM-dependent methyltransferase
MLDHEYDTMREVEDTYWWYQALRGYVAAEIKRLPLAGGPGRLLDAGCGTGGMMDRLRQTIPQWEITGLDFSPRAVDFTRRRGFDQVLEARLDAIPSPDAAWDAVVSLDVLYHVSVNEPRAMTELFRVLRPGGTLLLNLPAFDCLGGYHDVAVQGARRYTASRVRQLLEERGFHVRRLHYWNAWLFPAVFAWRRLSRLFDSADANGVTSDLGLLPGPLNRVLLVLAGLDLQVCRVLRPPFGTSVFAVAEKPAPRNTA